MATINGLSRNVGHSMLVDREDQYRHLTVEIFSQSFVRERYFRQLAFRDPSKIHKRQIWLWVMGLIETSDIPNDG